jgi:inner membrane protein
MITEYIHTHQAEFWILLGFVMLMIEVSMGLVTGLLLFGGVGAIITGLLMMAGILNETWQIGLASTAICSAIVSILLWKPLHNLQNKNVPTKDNSSDLVGYEFILEQDIDLLNTGTTQYSGIEWKVEVYKNAGVDKISAATRVTVCSVEVGRFKVKPL